MSLTAVFVFAIYTWSHLHGVIYIITLRHIMMADRWGKLLVGSGFGGRGCGRCSSSRQEGLFEEEGKPAAAGKINKMAKWDMPCFFSGLFPFFPFQCIIKCEGS